MPGFRNLLNRVNEATTVVDLEIEVNGVIEVVVTNGEEIRGCVEGVLSRLSLSLTKDKFAEPEAVVDVAELLASPGTETGGTTREFQKSTEGLECVTFWFCVDANELCGSQNVVL